MNDFYCQNTLLYMVYILYTDIKCKYKQRQQTGAIKNIHNNKISGERLDFCFFIFSLSRKYKGKTNEISEVLSQTTILNMVRIIYFIKLNRAQPNTWVHNKTKGKNTKVIRS